MSKMEAAAFLISDSDPLFHIFEGAKQTTIPCVLCKLGRQPVIMHAGIHAMIALALDDEP